jgi:hypothetical protein
MCGENYAKMKWREKNCGEDVMCGEVEWSEVHGEMWVHQFMTLSISLLLLFSVNILIF